MAGGQATINLQAAGTTRMSILASVSERDIDASVQVSTNKAAVGGNQFAYLILRRKDNGNQYQARFALPPTERSSFKRAASSTARNSSSAPKRRLPD